MAKDPNKERDPDPIVIVVPYSEVRVRKETVYPGFLAAGLSIADADELCRLIQAE